MIFSNFANKLRSPYHFRLSSEIKIRSFSLFHGIKAFEYIEGSPVNPSTILAHTLETLNSVSGLGWPATIVSFTLGMRLLIFPAYVKQTKATIMANNLKDEVTSFQTRIQMFRSKNQFPEARQELQDMYNFLRKKNCHPIRTIVLSLLPVPFFMSTFFALRNMARQPIESFIDGGAGWFLNLAESDPLFILPVLSCVSLLASFEVRLIFQILFNI
jgi:YidC/Oxa1 family membrane protein insertase